MQGDVDIGPLGAKGLHHTGQIAVDHRASHTDGKLPLLALRHVACHIGCALYLA